MTAQSPEHTPVAPEHSRGLRLGFARGIAPSTWAKRWQAVAPSIPLELVPLPLSYGYVGVNGETQRMQLIDDVDVLIERTLPGVRPAGVDDTETAAASRHAIRLYTEQIAVVVARDHELADHDTVSLAELALCTLLDYRFHAGVWPAAAAWDDPSWKPESVAGALELVATGAGAILLPVSLARHLVKKREHAVLRLVGDALPEGCDVWASWSRAQNTEAVQLLVSVFRGRTAASSRGGEHPAAEAQAEAASATSRSRGVQGKTGAAKRALNPKSRGAQLAAAQQKREAKRAAARKGSTPKRSRRS